MYYNHSVMRSTN